MSKEDILKIQIRVLKVNIHCDGCKQKVKNILQKIDGVFTTTVDADQGKVTVTCNVEPAVLIKKLAKSGKHAELWGASKPNNNSQNHLANQFKNMQIDNGKGGGGSNNNKGQKGGNNKPKDGGTAAAVSTVSEGWPQGQQQQQQFQQHVQQLQQLQQMKGLQDLKLPQFRDLKMPGQNPNQKDVKFNLPEEDDLADDEDYDDEFDGDFNDPEVPLTKMKPAMANCQRPGMMMDGLMNGQHPQLMAAQKGRNAGGNNKKGGSGGGAVAVPIQVNGMGGGNNGKNGTGGKNGGAGGGGNNHGQSGGKQNGGKNGGFAQQGKNGNNGGGANNKMNNNGNGGAHGNNSENGGRKFNGMSEGPHPMSNGFQNMNPHTATSAGAKMGAMGNMNNMPIAQMSNMSMGRMGSIPAVEGLPATAMNGGGCAGYFQGAGPDLMAGNPYHQQQQYLAAMTNQHRGMGNDRYQPMMYARPPPAVNYMPPYAYTPQQPLADPYTDYFSDENTTSSCSVM